MGLLISDDTNFGKLSERPLPAEAVQKLVSFGG